MGEKGLFNTPPRCALGQQKLRELFDCSASSLCVCVLLALFCLRTCVVYTGVGGVKYAWCA